MTLKNRLHGYSFKSRTAQDRVEKILAAFKAAPDQRMNSRDVALALGISGVLANTYLVGMHMTLRLIKPVALGSWRNNIYTLGEDPELEERIAELGGIGERRVVRRKASDVKTPCPVDPMRQYLFGHLSKQG